MSDKAISVENLGKCYQIGELEDYYTLRDSLTNILKFPFRLIKSNGNKSKISKTEYIWALKDINFEINQGEIIGIIGRNGAGKSTLLKILSRITTPTEGKVKIKGRVGSLLEVGTGFHPELTGRENIYLNGSILGMSKKEIQRKFDQIVDFAEIEKFLDTPVKRYSSGMYVRLAFAVAAHMEPEILVVDEVLAVGDIAFQKKCLGKMNNVASEGRTIVFVSHQMNAIKNLCERSILLDSGKIITDDETYNTINVYINSIERDSIDNLSLRKDRKGDGRVKIQSVQILNKDYDKIPCFKSGEYGIISINIVNTYPGEKIKNFVLALGINDNYGQRITLLSNELTNESFTFDSEEKNKVNIHIEKIPFMPGRYSYTIFAKVNEDLSDWIENAGLFDVEEGDYYTTGKLIPKNQGNFLVNHYFEIP